MVASNLVDKICTLKSNKFYRVADIFYNRGFRWEDSAAEVLDGVEFDGTILKEYLVKNDRYPLQNLKLLAEIVHEHSQVREYQIPCEEVVIHIRAGDVVEHDWFLSKDLVAEISSFPDSDRVVFVTSFAFQEWPERNAWMYSEEKMSKNVSMITALFDELQCKFPKISFDVFSNDDIDRDFAYMCGATKFVRDFGGFSELIDELRPLVAELRPE